MNTSAQLVKLFAPELIPEPLRLSGVELEQYTKKVYDYLRRLQAAMGMILEFVKVDIENTGDLVRVYVDVTAAVVKRYITSDDWRGKTIRFWANFFDKAGGSTVANANGGVWKQYFTGINNSIGTGRVGASYNGVDVQLGAVTVNTGVDGGNLQLWIDGTNGRLFVDSFTGGFGNRFQCELVIEGSNKTSVADITI